MQYHFDPILLLEVTGQAISCVDRAMLPTGTAEIYLQVGKTTVDIILYRMVDNPVDILEIIAYFAMVLKEINNRFISSSQLFIRFVAAGIMNKGRIKNKAAIVAAIVFRHTGLLVAEAVDGHRQ